MSRLPKMFVGLFIALLLVAAPLAQAQMTPAVEVSDQEIVDGTVTVARVVSDGPGWIVIHADAEGSPGPVIGYSAVQDGENLDVVVEIDVSMATETLYAMLHTDAGEEGTYEFPGADGPVSVEGEVVTPAFMVTGGLETEGMAQEGVTPAVEVSDQELMDSTVTVDRVVSDGPGWIVIHADDNGSPGAVIGHSAVQDGENLDVSVQISVTQATETLYAMLHTDAGEQGTYEFPGADGPVSVDGQVLAPAFMITGGLAQATPEATQQPETLPETGGTSLPWLPIVLVAVGLLIILGAWLLNQRVETEEVHVDK